MLALTVALTVITFELRANIHYEEKTLEQIQVLVLKVSKDIHILSAEDRKAFRKWVDNGLIPPKMWRNPTELTLNKEK